LVGNIVFARRAVRSNSAHKVVDKLQFVYTGPWHVIAILKGASNKLEHVHKPGRKEKKHASDLSPYPIELIPFKPIDGADTRYKQHYKPITAHPFKDTGIKGFSPLKPYQVTATLALTNRCLDFHWPSLSKLNDELLPFWWEDDDEYQRCIDGKSISTHPILTTGPPPAAPT
jgi:hypothetical protein